MKCPGQDMKYWKADAIFDVKCPKCEKMVEFYKDDTNRKCNHCGHRFVNPQMDFGCATYCQFAEQCLGTLPEDFRSINADNLLKDKVAVAMKRHFHTDFKKIREAVTTAQYAETIAKAEEASLPIILCAAYLHGTGAETATDILQKLGAADELTSGIRGILTSLDNVSSESPLHVLVVHDARTLSILHDKQKKNDTNADSFAPLADTLYTNSAREIARTLSAQ